MKRLLAASLVSLGLAATPASAIIVGGIDFGVLGNTEHLETTTLAQTFINAAGQQLSGYGLVTTVNGDSTYCADGSANCALYFFFHDYTVQTFSPTYTTLTGGVVDIYFSGAPAANLLNQDSNANIAFITSLTPWVQLTGHTFLDAFFGTVQTLNGTGALTGASLSQTGTGQLDVNAGAFGLAAVQTYLNGNGIGDNLGGFADIVVTSSSNNAVLNPFDAAGPLADSCQTGSPQPGDWCLQGTLNTRGLVNVVPEPGTLALLGLGLFAIGAMPRKNRA
jgi:PEP-CTERM motif